MVTLLQLFVERSRQRGVPYGLDQVGLILHDRIYVDINTQIGRLPPLIKAESTNSLL